MDVTFVNPGAEYMIRQILLFQTENETAFWSAPLYHFYPQLDKEYAESLLFAARKEYIKHTLQAVYGQVENSIRTKVDLYTRHWEKHRAQITAALTDAFAVDCSKHFQHLRCNVSMNPISPRFLKEDSFDVFYLNSERGAVGLCIHEIIHFVWFHVWNQLWHDSYEEYERPSLKWILSEMVVESIMRDPRLSSINPYFPREQGGCIYPYFFDIKADGVLVLDTLDEMYQTQSITDFMKSSYVYCQAHEAEIRAHIQASENAR